MRAESQLKPVSVATPPAKAISTPSGKSRRGSFVVVNPRYEAELAALNLRTAEAFLTLPGEVVSGHPDRHVMQVRLSDSHIAYLKRQHIVRTKERVRNALAGFGFVSKSVREARMLIDLESAGFAVPGWIAHGETGDGRAFLLVDEVRNTVDLRIFLADARISIEERRRCAERLGQLYAELHLAGFHYPDATAKHVLVNPETLSFTLLDWQSAKRLPNVPERLRTRSLAALHASLADDLTLPQERAHFLWAYRRVLRDNAMSPFHSHVAAIRQTATALRHHRSIRDQRLSPAGTTSQRLVWLAGEAMCVVPDVAATWPTPADGEPFYSTTQTADRFATERITLADGRNAWLIRGQSFTPLARFRAALRGKPWRSPELVLARVLFHFERFAVPTPRLLAFGQKLISACRAKSFVLYEPPVGSVPFETWHRTSMNDETRARILTDAGLLLRQVHDSDCLLEGPFAAEPVFHVTPREPLVPVVFGAVRSVRLTRELNDRARLRDLRRLFRGPLGILDRDERLSLLRGYFGSRFNNDYERLCNV